MFDDFFNQLNASPWKGAIAEVGIGVPFLNEMLNRAGASKTLIYGCTPYAVETQPVIGRRVSEANAFELAVEMYYKSMDVKEAVPRFGFASTGVHADLKGSGKTHAWMACLTNEETHVCHVRLPKYLCRADAARMLAEISRWFLGGTLLGHGWSTASLPAPACIDVLRGPSVTLKDQLGLLTKHNPLYFGPNLVMDRVVDTLRQTVSLYAGSFNPPTAAHTEMGDGSLYVLGTDNARKGSICMDDIAHRVRMVSDVLSRPLLVTMGVPKFVELHALLSRLGLETNATYVQGTDTFNAMVAQDHDSVARNMKGCTFLVHPRTEPRVPFDVPGIEVTEGNCHLLLSSTQARNGDLTVCDDRVANYIKEHNLYASS